MLVYTLRWNNLPTQQSKYPFTQKLTLYPNNNNNIIYSSLVSDKKSNPFEKHHQATKNDSLLNGFQNR